jgi:hypothetical protein
MDGLSYGESSSCRGTAIRICYASLELQVPAAWVNIPVAVTLPHQRYSAPVPWGSIVTVAFPPLQAMVDYAIVLRTMERAEIW